MNNTKGYNMIKVIFIFSILLHSMSVGACVAPHESFDKMKNSTKYTVEGPYTAEEMEKNNLVEIKLLSKFMEGNSKTEEIKKIPFGYQNKVWVTLKEKYKKGDSFYSVVFHIENFVSGSTILVRGNCIIGSFSGFRS